MPSRARHRQRTTTMTDIARFCGVSQPTVSDVLNDKWRAKGIAKGTRDRVLDAARQLHFRRNGIARRLVAGRTDLIGLVLPYVSGSFFARITFALEMQARRRGYHVILCHSYNRREQEEREMELLLELRVDGMIIAPSYDAPAGKAYSELQHQHVPFVFLDSYIDGIAAPFVGTDDVLGGYTATRHLIDLGRRNITHLAGPLRSSGMTGRLNGYRKALEESDLAFHSEFVAETEVNDYHRAQRAVTQWLEDSPSIDAIFAATDMLAVAAINATRAAGRRVPDDVAVVGYADLYSTGLGLDLTTVRQPTEDIGKTAADLLIDRLEGIQTDRPKRFLPPQLIVRGSCGAPYRRLEDEAASIFVPDMGLSPRGIPERRTS